MSDVHLRVAEILGEQPPEFKSIDLSKITFDQLMQLRTAVAALWLSGKSASESLRDALNVENGATRDALLRDIQVACHRNRQAMKVIMDVIV
jgi:hypothetical protein